MEDTTRHIGLTDAQLKETEKQFVDPELLQEGHDLIDRERATSVRATVRSHWRGIFWSICLSFALVMDGFDGSMMFGFFGHPAFLRKFGELQPNGEYLISANWQTLIGNMTTVGNIIGLFITGYAQERFGSRKTYIGGMMLITVLIFIPVFATSIGMILAGSMLMGIPWGLFNTLSTAYAAEIAPIRLRGVAAAFVNMAWGIGLVLSAGVVRASLTIVGDWAWRMPFTLQWIWPIPLAVLCFFAPESPWWLVRKGRFEDAKAALAATAVPGHYTDRELSAHIAVMTHTDATEKAEASKGSYIECFKGSNLRRTEVMFGVWLIQVWGGQGITNLTVLFLLAAGLSVDMSFTLNIVLTSMIIIGAIVSWFLLPYFGRRPIYLIGLVLTSISLVCIGAMGCVTPTNAIRYTSAAFMIFINFLYACSIGPLCYTIAGELPSARLRSKTIVLGRFVYVLCGFITGQLNPRMLSPTAWNWGSKSAFFWLGTNALCILWAFFRLPETGGFTFGELDILFANKTPARQFKNVAIHHSQASHGVTEEVATASLDEKYDGKTALERDHVENVPTLR